MTEAGHVRIQVEGLSGSLPVRTLSGREAMNELSFFRALVHATLHPSELEGLLGANAILQLIDDGEATERPIPLVILAIELIEETLDHLTLAFELVPAHQLLAERGGYRIWVERTTIEIVQEVLDAVGLAGLLEPRLSSEYAVRNQCVQYDESDWDFVTRLLADEGISCWFDDEEGEPRMILGDSPDSNLGLAIEPRVPFHEASEMTAERHLGRLEFVDRYVCENVHIKEDSIRQPDVPFEGKAGEGPGLYFEYPARVESEDAAQARARVRLEQITRHAKQAFGESNVMRMAPGRIVEIEGDLDEEMAGRYLIVSVQHRYVASASGTMGAQSYSNDVTLVPADRFFRPAQPAWPAIADVEPATTTGPAGDEIHVNDLGDVTLKMPWDRSTVQDETSSWWARTLQANQGGSMMLPRMGWEVPVMYRNGDPDRPLVLGRYYNAGSAVPYELPDEAASTGFQSATTPGGGSTNEIKLGDTKGAESMATHASHDQDVVVGGSATTTVSVNQTHDVALSYAISTKTQSVTVSGEQKVGVAMDYTTGVGGGRTESVGGAESCKVDGDRVVESGGDYSEMIGGLQATQCIAATLETKGNFLNLVGGASSHTAAAGCNETVSGARNHAVGAARGITCSSYGETIAGVRSIQAGASKLEAGGKWSTKCANGSVSAASIKGKASGNVVFKGKTIAINAAGVTTPGGTIKGTVKAKGGNFTADIKNSGGTKISS